MPAPRVLLLDLDSELDENWQGKSHPSFLARFEQILDANAIEHRRIRYDQNFWTTAKDYSHFIARPKGAEPDLMLMEAILPELERMGISCLPSEATFKCTGDKLRIACFFAANDIPSPATDALFTIRDADDWLARNGKFPVVAKLRKGASSRNVALLEDGDQLRKVCESMFGGRLYDGDLGAKFGRNAKSLSVRVLQKNIRTRFDKRETPVRSDCLLLQEYLPDNSYDTRVTVIGQRAFAFCRLNRPGDFRASGSGLIDFDISAVRQDCLNLAFSISDRFKFQSMAYDFAFDCHNQPAVIEMNYTYVSEAVRACPGYFDRSLTFVPSTGRSPQVYQLQDFIGAELIHSD